jgi:hypothetical protein
VQVLPLQQLPPAPPHTWQSEFLQMVPASLQVELAQQGPPAAPHALHVLGLVVLSQTVPGSLHTVVVEVELEQQACPVPPHSLHE